MNCWKSRKRSAGGWEEHFEKFRAPGEDAGGDKCVTINGEWKKKLANEHLFEFRVNRERPLILRNKCSFFSRLLLQCALDAGGNEMEKEIEMERNKCVDLPAGLRPPVLAGVASPPRPSAASPASGLLPSFPI